MKKFRQDTIILAIGIVLPFITMLLFGLVTILPKYFVAPPKYNLVIATSNYMSDVRFQVSDRKLKAQFICNKTCMSDMRYTQTVKLYIFDVATRKTKEVPIHFPVIDKNADTFITDLTIPELANATIDPANEAPDGYSYHSYANDFSLTSLFFGNKLATPFIAKNGYSIPINFSSDPYRFYNAQFIGWILK